MTFLAAPWRSQFLLLMMEEIELAHALWTAYRLNEGYEEGGNGVVR